MAAYNVVRFRVKPGRVEEFVEAHRQASADIPGFVRGVLVRTGERTFCFIGEWSGHAQLQAAETAMIAILDRFRDTLEDLGAGLGVTDPVSGEAVLELKP